MISSITMQITCTMRKKPSFFNRNPESFTYTSQRTYLIDDSPEEIKSAKQKAANDITECLSALDCVNYELLNYVCDNINIVPAEKAFSLRVLEKELTLEQLCKVLKKLDIPLVINYK